MEMRTNDLFLRPMEDGRKIGNEVLSEDTTPALKHTWHQHRAGLPEIAQQALFSRSNETRLTENHEMKESEVRLHIIDAKDGKKGLT